MAGFLARDGSGSRGEAVKRHGLWQFHRALKEGKCSVKWWAMETEQEQNLVRSMVGRITGSFLGGGFVQSPYRVADIIARCAHRYMRRFGIRMNVEHWNDVCEMVGRRMQARPQSLKAIQIYRNVARSKAPVLFEDGWIPTVKHGIWEVRARRDKIAAYIKWRDEGRYKAALKMCCVCKKRESKRYEYWGSGNSWSAGSKLLDWDLIAPIQAPSGKLGFCVPCHLQMSKHVKAWERAEQERLLVGRTRRKIYEGTKDNAGAARRSGLHHGGSDQRGCEDGRGAASPECGHAHH